MTRGEVIGAAAIGMFAAILVGGIFWVLMFKLGPDRGRADAILDIAPLLTYRTAGGYEYNLYEIVIRPADADVRCMVLQEVAGSDIALDCGEGLQDR